jgi:WD40 repeat protein
VPSIFADVDSRLSDIGLLSYPQPIAFSSNGKWLAITTSNGIVIAGSDTFDLLAFIRVDAEYRFDVAFDPTSRYLVLAHENGVSIWSVEDRPEGIAIAPSEPGIGMSPMSPEQSLAFDKTGARLAVLDRDGAVVVDFKRRVPIAGLSANIHPTLIGFSGSSLFLVELASSACKCDDYQGAPAAVAEWTVGSRRMSLRRLIGNPGGTAAIRQGKLASDEGLWNLRTGVRLKNTRTADEWGPLDIALARTDDRWAAIGTGSDPKKPDVRLFDASGATRVLGTPAEEGSALSFRPQGDAVVVVGQHDQQQIVIQVFPIDGSPSRTVRHEPVQCIIGTAWHPRSDCLKAAPGTKLADPPRGTEIPETDFGKAVHVQGPDRPASWPRQREGEEGDGDPGGHVLMR